MQDNPFPRYTHSYDLWKEGWEDESLVKSVQLVGAASQINNAAPSDAGVLTYEMLKNYFAESNEPPSTFIRLERLPKLTPEQQKKMEQDFSKMIDRIFGLGEGDK